MKVVADFCIIPVGVGVSLSKYIAECEIIIHKRGLVHFLHGYGTNIEGEWDDVMAAVKECHERLHEMGVPRISTSLKLGTRNDREQSMKGKVESVENKLKKFQET